MRNEYDELIINQRQKEDVEFGLLLNDHIQLTARWWSHQDYCGTARHHEFVADALIELEYRLEIEMVIPYYYQFLLQRESIIVNLTSVVST
eukprot:Em0006g749a